MQREQIVRVYCGWTGFKSLQRQSPASSGVWNDYRFYIDGESSSNAPNEVDYLIVYNGALSELRCRCRRGVWLIAGEPPSKLHEYYRQGYHQYDKLITQHPTHRGSNHLKSHGALPWHISESYDQLKVLPLNVREKRDTVCAVVSTANCLPGHTTRFAFLQALQSSSLQFQLYGRGIRALPEDNKLHVLYPSKYALAIENSYYRDYWTEKIADCFLSWTMPIYAGAPNITEYFPEESMLLVDPERPEEAIAQIQEAIASRRWERNIDAIAAARELVLERYQFFPFITALFDEDRSLTGGSRRTREIVLSPIDVGAPIGFSEKVIAKLQSFARSSNSLLSTFRN